MGPAGSRWRYAEAVTGTQTPDHTDPFIPDPFRDAVPCLPCASILQWSRGRSHFCGGPLRVSLVDSFLLIFFHLNSKLPPRRVG